MSHLSSPMIYFIPYVKETTRSIKQQCFLFLLAAAFSLSKVKSDDIRVISSFGQIEKMLDRLYHIRLFSRLKQAE
jgi:hypothetical protein